jgi:hypothetical protein
MGFSTTPVAASRSKSSLLKTIRNIRPPVVIRNFDQPRPFIDRVGDFERHRRRAQR